MRAVFALAAAAQAFTVADKVYVNGELLAEGHGVDGVVGCRNESSGANAFKVCGCNVQVVANLLSNCGDYGKYSEKVGSCDCSKGNECQTSSQQAGYTNKFSWDAFSYEVRTCPQQ